MTTCKRMNEVSSTYNLGFHIRKKDDVLYCVNDDDEFELGDRPVKIRRYEYV